jgi:adenine-specific DNA-methyltransferase
MTKKQKLELTWVGKENRPRLEPRILLEDPEKSYHAKHRISDDDIFDNRLIFGDNLLALKALEQEFAGKVKCVFIDPPYNTGSAFEHYDDGLEHSIWLGLMRDRLEIIRKILAEDGTLWITIDDNEAHYLKVLCDEIFGRGNFINQISAKMKFTSGASGGGEDKKLKKNIEYILVYCKNNDSELGFRKFNDVYDEEDLFELIEGMREEGKSWKYTRVLRDLGNREFLRDITDGSGEKIRIYRHIGVKMEPITSIMKDENLTEQECYVRYFGKIFRDTNAQSSIRTRVMEAVEGSGDFFSIEYTPRSGKNKGRTSTLYYKGTNCDLIAWLSDVATKKGNRLLKLEKAGTYWEGFPLNNLTKEGGVQFPQGKKPEALMRKVLELATDPGDLVLDSFAGSGTTGAVAHKMGRRWIMVELGEHCDTHIIPRLRKVIDGEDKGGVTEVTGWQGGGGFRYFKLAPSLLDKDKWGREVISKAYNAEMLAEALCKIEGFTYAPSDSVYWQHGTSTERDFIYVTTQTLSPEQLDALSEEVGEDRTLLVLCAAFRGNTSAWPNLTVKKIPNHIRERCEWGHDDYSLNVENLPKASPTTKTIDKASPRSASQPGLFDLAGDDQ